MKIFRLWGSQDYWSINYESSVGIKSERYLAEYKGISVSEDWQKMEASIVFEGELSGIKPDIMDVGGLVGVAITVHTMDILKDLLIPYCELLPLDLNGEEIYLINPTVILDCIDYDKSVTKLLPPMYNEKIVKYVFKKEMDYPPVFRVKNESFRIFITDELERLLTNNHLVGCDIKELWNSEE